MLSRNCLPRGSNQWLRCASKASRSSRGMAAAAQVNPFYFNTSEEAGIKIAARDDGAPTTSLALVIRAGSRYEPQPGLAHGLQQFTWKNTDRRSALRVQRESELLGSVIGSSLSRENIVLRAQFLRKDLPYFIEAMGDILTSTRFQHHVFKEEVALTMKHNLDNIKQNASALALENTLGVAFHKGLGYSKLATSLKYVDPGRIEQYANSAFTKSNIALVASGAEHSELSKWTNELLKGVNAGPALSSPASKYYGGESRLYSSNSGSSFVVAFPGSANTPFKAEYKVLTHLLGGQTAVKWNSGFSLLSRAVANIPGVSAVANHLQFTDAGLIYITVTGPDAHLQKAGEAVVKAVNDVATISAEEVKKAIAQAKFDVLAEVEDRSIGLELVGQSILSSGKAPQAEEIVKALESVTVQSVQNAAKHILAGRASFAAVGDTHVLPYAEDIGLKV